MEGVPAPARYHLNRKKTQIQTGIAHLGFLPTKHRSLLTLHRRYLGFQVIHVIQVCDNIIRWSLILGYALLQLPIHVSSNISCYFSSPCSLYSQHLPWRQTQLSCFPHTRATGEWLSWTSDGEGRAFPLLSHVQTTAGSWQSNQSYSCRLESTPRGAERPTCAVERSTATNRTETPQHLHCHLRFPAESAALGHQTSLCRHSTSPDTKQSPANSPSSLQNRSKPTF